MKNLVIGGIYTSPAFDNGYYILIDRLINGDFLLFKLNTDSNKSEDISNELKVILSTHTNEEIRRKFVEAHDKTFYKNHSGFLGVIEKQVSFKLQHIV